MPAREMAGTKTVAYEFHAKLALPHAEKSYGDNAERRLVGEGNFPSPVFPWGSSMGPTLIRLDRGKIVHPIQAPTIEIRMSKGLLKALDHEWLVVEVNQLRPIAAIPKVYERPVPLPLDEIDNLYDVEVRLDIAEHRRWSPELCGEIEVVLRGTER
jgi:hypothetical protein